MSCAPSPPRAAPGRQLRSRSRYGYEAAILVRVDDVGEIYPRLAEGGDTTSPALRLLTDEDDE